MIDYYLLEARVSFCVCKNSCHVVQKLPCCLSGSSLSSDIATQVTCIVCAQCSSRFSSSDVVTCFLLFGRLVFLFTFTTPYRGFIACGRSNVWSGAAAVGAVKRSRSPHRKDQALVGGSQAGGPPGNGQDQQVEEPPKEEQPDNAMEVEAKSLGRVLMETLTTASKSLLACSETLEKNVVLLEECRADSSSIQSMAAGVNYYVSTTKASQRRRPPNINRWHGTGWVIPGRSSHWRRRWNQCVTSANALARLHIR